MRYENFYCSNENADQPEWFDITLGEKDIANIEMARGLLTEDVLGVELEFHGTVDWEGDARMVCFVLSVGTFVWFRCFEEYVDATYEIQLENGNENN